MRKSLKVLKSKVGRSYETKRGGGEVAERGGEVKAEMLKG
jgi:hypothetical protein